MFGARNYMFFHPILSNAYAVMIHSSRFNIRQTLRNSELMSHVIELDPSKVVKISNLRIVAILSGHFVFCNLKRNTNAEVVSNTLATIPFLVYQNEQPLQ